MKAIAKLKQILNAILSIANDLQEIKIILQKIEQHGQAIRTHTWIAKEANIISVQDVAILNCPKYKDDRSLIKFQAQVFSQNGEDGIIAEIFNRIGTSDKIFVELGVENGIECNSRFLLNCGWRGLWIEGNLESCQAASDRFKSNITNNQLKIVHHFLTKDNIQQLLSDNQIPQEFDFLSVDLDLNTHHIWWAISNFKPRVVCIEYNASIPPSVNYSVPYDPHGTWDGSNYFGAGLKALEIIGNKLGYKLVGCEYLGINAFFIREDCCQPMESKFLPPFTAEFHYEPPRYALNNHRGHFKTAINLS
jgi:hypothetical protein